jgi:hypothetical protein
MGRLFVQTVHNVAVAEPKRGSKRPVVAAQVHHEAAGRIGRLKDLFGERPGTKQFSGRGVGPGRPNGSGEASGQNAYEWKKVRQALHGALQGAG